MAPNAEKPQWALALKARREAVVGSQEELSARSGISQSLISQLERGVQQPSGLAVERFAKLLDTLNWTVGEFEEAIARAWEPFAAGKIPQSVAERLAAPYAAELERLRAEYAPQPQSPAPNFAAQAAQFAAALRGGALTFEDKRELLAALDVRLYIGPDGPERVTVSIP